MVGSGGRDEYGPYPGFPPHRKKMTPTQEMLFSRNPLTGGMLVVSIGHPICSQGDLRFLNEPLTVIVADPGVTGDTQQGQSHLIR